MKPSQILTLVFSALVLASPQHSWRGKWHDHFNDNEASAGVEKDGASTAMPSGPTSVLPLGGSGLAMGDSPGAKSSSTSTAQTAVQSPPVYSPPAQAPAQAVSSTSTTSIAPTSPATSATSSGSTGSGPTYSATFTEYGSGDQNGSPNCNTATAACGFYTSPGFNAAVSQNLYGAGPGQGAGPACGLCYKLTALTNPYADNAALSAAGTSIVVKINNLCPAQGNPLCAQSSLTAVNSLGANVNFDLCKDDGAAAALFNSSGVTAAAGTAELVSCDLWTGSGDITS